MPFVGYNDPSDSPTVTINGTDYTAFLAGGNAFDVQQTLPTIPRDDERRAKFEPILAIGSINLFADQEILVIDWEAAISNDLKEGRPIIITTQHNTYRLRVRNWDVTDQDPCTGTIRSIQINVTDLLGLINRDTKRPGVQAYQTLLSGEGLSSANPVILWQNAVRLIGQFPRKANDQPYLIAADFDLPSGNFTENGFLDTETVPTGTFNAAEAIASILYARGYACWCDPADERIKVAPIPLDVSAETPVYRWDCRQLQAFTVSRGTEEPVDRVEATVQSVKTRFRVIRNGVSIADD